MSHIKHELSGKGDASDERLVKKMRLDNGILFKVKGNEKQQDFNEKVKNKIESASKQRRHCRKVRSCLLLDRS